MFRAKHIYIQPSVYPFATLKQVVSSKVVIMRDQSTNVDDKLYAVSLKKFKKSLHNPVCLNFTMCVYADGAPKALNDRIYAVSF